MRVVESERLTITCDQDVVQGRRRVGAAARAQGMSALRQTRLMTAASELLRNALVHGGGGRARVDRVETPRGRGVRVVVEDDGCGIADVEQALRDGYTTHGGLGLGLGGAKRLTDEFEIRTAPGEGTRVTVVSWS